MVASPLFERLGGMGAVTAVVGEFNALVEDLVATLNKFGVGKREQDELLGILGPLNSENRRGRLARPACHYRRATKRLRRSRPQRAMPTESAVARRAACERRLCRGEASDRNAIRRWRDVGEAELVAEGHG